MRYLRISLAAICLGITSGLQAQTDGYEGITSPYRIIEVATQESGILKDMRVKAGDNVSKGQTIALLDNAMLSASLAIAKARMSARAGIDGAIERYKTNVRRLKTLQKLAKSGGARPDELDQAKSNVAIAQAEIDSQRELLKIAELEHQRLKTQLTQRTITSPIDGVVVSLDREPGELVGPSQSVIVRVADLDQLNLISHLPQDIAEQTTLGHEIPVTLNSGEVVNGIVEFISPVVDPRSATIEVKVLIDNQHRRIRSGMRARLMIDRTVSSVTN